MRKSILSWFMFVVGMTCLHAQDQVSLSVVFTDSPFNLRFRLTITNNNPGGSGWAIDQTHILFPTGGVLQNVQAPANWVATGDVPWDAIPRNLRYQTSNVAARIDPGESLSFEFSTSVPTQVNDLYIQYRVRNGATLLDYAQRSDVTPRTNLSSDGLIVQEVQVAAATAPNPPPGPGGGRVLQFNYDFDRPVTRSQIRTRDEQGNTRDFTRYPIDNLTTLPHFFLGDVSREVSATGSPPRNYWTSCLEAAQWCSSGVNLSELRWVNGPFVEPEATFGWRFSPSYPDSGAGPRQVRFQLTNLSQEFPLFVNQLRFHLRGARALQCGADVNTWTSRFPSDFVANNFVLNPRQTREFFLTIPAGTPPKRFFYGFLEMRVPSDPSDQPTRAYFVQEELNSLPLASGIVRAPVPDVNLARLIHITASNPDTGESFIFEANSNALGRWRVPFSVDLLDIPGLYRPIWTVKVKPRGALQMAFPQTLLVGGDTLDPYLRQMMILGDINEDNVIDDLDLLQMLIEFGLAGVPSDLDGNGVADDRDLMHVLFNFGRTGD